MGEPSSVHEKVLQDSLLSTDRKLVEAEWLYGSQWQVIIEVKRKSITPSQCSISQQIGTGSAELLVPKRPACPLEIRMDDPRLLGHVSLAARFSKDSLPGDRFPIFVGTITQKAVHELQPGLRFDGLVLKKKIAWDTETYNSRFVDPVQLIHQFLDPSFQAPLFRPPLISALC